MEPMSDQVVGEGHAEVLRTDTLKEPELWLLVRVGMLVGGLGYWHPACIGIHEKLLDSRGFLQWTLDELSRLFGLPPDAAAELGRELVRREELKARLVELRALWDLGVASNPNIYDEVVRRREEMSCYVQLPIIEQTWEALLRVHGDDIWQFVIPYQDLCDEWGIEDQLGNTWRETRETLQEYTPKLYD